MSRTVEQLIGQTVKTHRETLGWSQEHLAAKMTDAGIAMHQTTIAKLEQAARPIRVNEVWMLAELLETTPAEVMGLGSSAPDAISARLRGAVDELTELSAVLEQRKRQITRRLPR